MVYKFSVKYGGVIYPAGVNVPDKPVKVEKPVAEKFANGEETKRRGRPKKE